MMIGFEKKTTMFRIHHKFLDYFVGNIGQVGLTSLFIKLLLHTSITTATIMMPPYTIHKK